MKSIIKGSLIAFLATSSIYAGGDIGEPVEPLVVIPDIVEPSESTRAYNTALKIGTLGVGFDASTAINDAWAVRFNLNGFNYTMDDKEIDDISYDADLELLTAGVLLDYFPFENDFRMSGGVYYNNNKFKGSAKPTATTKIDINGKEYGLDDIGRLDSEVEFDKAAPYLGLGWGNDSREKGWGFTFDLGVMYHGEPNVDLDVEVNPLIAGTPAETAINNNVDKETEAFLDEVKDYKFYPVVMIGVNYTF